MIVEFDSSKITNAIASAMRSVDERMTESGDDTEISSGTISYLSETLTNEVIDMLKTKSLMRKHLVLKKYKTQLNVF